MKTFRKIFLVIALILAVGSVATFADAFSNANYELAIKATVYGTFAVAIPAAVRKGPSNVLGFMGGGLSRTEQQLIDYLADGKQIDPATLKKYYSGDLRLVSAYFYKRKNITGLSGVFTMMDETDVKVTGITNLHQGKLDDGVNAIIDRILIGHATHATETDPKKVVLDSALSGFPAGIVNGHIIIKVDGSIAVDPIPAKLCASQADATTAAGKYDSIEITPFILPEGKQITVEFEVPNGAALSANQTHLEIMLLGSKTRNRSRF